MEHSSTELKNIMRMYQYTFTALAEDIGITKSYLSKIINKRVRSPKHEHMIAEKITELKKKEPKIKGKKKVKNFCSFEIITVKDIGLRNGIQIILDKNKMTITQLAREINEARSSVSQVVNGERQTIRIIKKIIIHLKLDGDIFFNRTIEDNKYIAEGNFLPLVTKALARKRERETERSLKKDVKTLEKKMKGIAP